MVSAATFGQHTPTNQPMELIQFYMTHKIHIDGPKLSVYIIIIGNYDVRSPGNYNKVMRSYPKLYMYIRNAKVDLIFRLSTKLFCH